MLSIGVMAFASSITESTVRYRAVTKILVSVYSCI